MPDVSIMQDLCKILNITLNELFIGEKIEDDNYKEVADDNLFYKKKWKKEHICKIIFSFISWLVLIVALKLQNVEIYLIATIAGMLSILLYAILYNQMMIYVEDHAYKKIEK